MHFATILDHTWHYHYYFFILYLSICISSLHKPILSIHFCTIVNVSNIFSFYLDSILYSLV